MSNTSRERLLLNTKYVRDMLILNEMTYAELAEKMHISRNTLRTYLQNPERVSLETINNMAAALNQRYSSDFVLEDFGGSDV